MAKVIEASKCNPRYIHDCDHCQFVGQDGEFDLYYHDSENMAIAATIARYGHEASEHKSGDVNYQGRLSPELGNARKLWIKNHANV